MQTPDRARRRLEVQGRVQGVGFRPYVERLARREALDGFVANIGDGVAIEVEGPAAALDRFARSLPDEAPVVATVEAVQAAALDPTGAAGFAVAASRCAPSGALPRIAADRAVCAECAAAIRDPANRRFAHPFASCVVCGPRYSVLARLPYDRANTAMAAFDLCPSCRSEYADAASRFGRAEALACPDCGPRLLLRRPGAPDLRADAGALTTAAEMLRAGAILAVKGIGGFHLMTRADDPAAVARLRDRKRRKRKPFAVMFGDLAAVEALCAVDDLERSALTGPAAPIVLLDRLDADIAAGAGAICDAVAPGARRVGAMLAYTPLHLLLIDAVGTPLVATSGNPTGDGVVYRDADVADRLAPLADGVLSHDRPILRPLEDSIVQATDGRLQTLRLGRGLAPLRLPLPGPLPAPTLALGGHWKAAPALGLDARAALGAHVGDVEAEAALDELARAAEDLPGLHGCRPALCALDRHPDTPAMDIAAAHGLPARRTQHHVAHAAAVAAEHGLELPALAIVWDGAGYGADGTVWGGETLRLDPGGRWRRLGRLRPIPLIGGDAAIRDPRRTALALAGEAVDAPPEALAGFAGLDDATAKALLAMRRSGVGVQDASSVGRLFDGLAVLLGLAGPVEFEGEAAMALQAAAERATAPAATLPLPWGETSEGPLELDWRPLVRAILTMRDSDTAAAAACVHESLAAAAVAAAERAGLDRVLLAGGCFQNRLLLERGAQGLRQAGFAPYWSEQVPANDGGLAYGQLAWTAWESA